MASRRKEIVIFIIDKKLRKKKKKLHVSLTLVISASGKARYLFQKKIQSTKKDLKDERNLDSVAQTVWKWQAKELTDFKIIGLQKLWTNAKRLSHLLMKKTKIPMYVKA